MTPRVLPFGSWPTPITSKLLVSSAVGLSEARVDGEDVIWSEVRPSEAGRVQLVRRALAGTTTELLPSGMSARTAVHEYGGGGWWARAGTVWFSAWEDQRLYRLDAATGRPLALTPEPAMARGDRYADGDISPDGRWIACIREHHPPGGRGAIDVRNEIVRLEAERPSTPEVLVSGPDFATSPRWSPDGRSLCWIEWDHPNMPWDGTRLLVRDLAGGEEVLIAGGADESVSEPQWRPDGSLSFISDRTGWWNLYRWAPEDGSVTPLVQTEAEIGLPPWVPGGARYAALPDGRIVFARSVGGIDTMAVRLPDGSTEDLDLTFTEISVVRPLGDSAVVVVAGSPTEEMSVSTIELGPAAEVRSVAAIRPGRDLTELGVATGYISAPEPIEFPTSGGDTAYGLFYGPTNPECEAPSEELPPLLVLIHGGPTSSARALLQLGIQYWTSRGFAVVDVNYRGSTGYGRGYRDALRGRWGEADVADCLAAARWLGERRRCDPDRLCIRGGSAGGYTVLAALAREDTPFAAGADRYGVADVEALAKDTHKFESRYTDTLIGPYPQERELYRRRSPIHHVDVFSRPLIVLQGSEDKVVPPSQSEMIVDALRAKSVPVAYLVFEGEQHGFRRAESIRRALDAELSFYGQVLGFDLPPEEGIEPVAVENLP